MKMVYLKSILHRFKGFKVPPNMPKIADLKHNNKWRHHAAICVISGCVSLTLSFDIFKQYFTIFACWGSWWTRNPPLLAI